MLRRSARTGKLVRGVLAVATIGGIVFGANLSSPLLAGAGVSGPTWAGLAPPLPANATSTATSRVEEVSCPAPGSCVAIGVYHVGASDAIFAASLANGTWTATQVPSPASDDGTDTGFNALSCPTVGWCVATGRYSNTLGNFPPFASTLSGGSWTSTVLPLPPTAANPSTGTQDRGLSCPTSGWCVTTGSYLDPSSHTQAYIDTLSGGSWTTMVAPLPPTPDADPEAVLKAVDCSASGMCVAGGTYLTTTPALETQGFFDTLFNQTWGPTVAPVPADAAAMPNPSILSVSCTPPQSTPRPLLLPGVCVAVGGYQNTSGGQPMAWVVANALVTAKKVPLPADASANPFAALTDVSCPVAGWCEAAGSYDTPAFTNGLPIVATLANNAWTTQVPPGVGPGDVGGYVQTISCSWPGSCVAAGLKLLSASQIAFFDTQVNGSWSGNGAVLPNGPIGSTESDTAKPSCVAGTCLVGGEFNNHPGQNLGYLDMYPNLNGYQEVANDGGLFSFNVPFNGSMGGKPLNAPIVGMAVEPDNGGYDEVATDGGIFAFNTPFQGSMGGKPLNAPIVGMAFDTQTGGYYEVASDGGLFAFNAPFDGSMGGKPLNRPIVGMAFDPMTGGYYEVASDGGLFAFNAPFQGSMGGKPLNKPIVGMAFDPTTGGYYEVASDGGLFAFNAPFQGSMGGKPLNQPIVGMAFDYATGGYYEVASDGGLFAFNAPFQGSMGGKPLNKPVVGLGFG